MHLAVPDKAIDLEVEVRADRQTQPPIHQSTLLFYSPLLSAKSTKLKQQQVLDSRQRGNAMRGIQGKLEEKLKEFLQVKNKTQSQ